MWIEWLADEYAAPLKEPTAQGWPTRPATLTVRCPINTSLAQQPREQSFQQSSAFRIHLSKFDTHLLTGDDAPDNRLRRNNPSGYFKNKGQARACAQRDGAAEGQTSHA